MPTTIVYSQFKDEVLDHLTPDFETTVTDLCKVLPGHHRTDVQEALRSLRMFRAAESKKEKLVPPGRGFTFLWRRI